MLWYLIKKKINYLCYISYSKIILVSEFKNLKINYDTKLKCICIFLSYNIKAILNFSFIKWPLD